MPKRQTLDQIETSLKRWHSRLKRAVKAIEKLDRARRRLVKADDDFAIKNAPEPSPARQEPPPVAVEPAAVSIPAKEVEPIPAFLWRGPVHAADEKAIAEIKANMDDHQKRKSRGRIAKLKADQSGERKRMPLSGKAALAKISESV